MVFRKMSAAYDQSRASQVWPSPLQGLTHFARSIKLGWLDCAESAKDWQLHLAKGVHSKQHSNLFFALLGQPLEGSDEYEAPWDDYEHRRLLRELGVEL